MKILLVWDFYDSYLRSFYSRRPEAAALSYAEHYHALLDDFFSWNSYLVRELEKLGHEARFLVGNARPLQQAWALEYGRPVDEQHWKYSILTEQIRQFQPDILWISGNNNYLGEFLKEIRPLCRYIIGWTALTSSLALDWSQVDCLFSSNKECIDKFRALGKQAELVMPCFDPSILHHLGPTTKDIPVSFIGSLPVPLFSARIETLGYIQKRVPLQVFAERPRWIRRPWPLRPFLNQFRFLPFFLKTKLREAVYGLEMFKVLRRSVVTVNVHRDMTVGLDQNIRTFEATGVGTLLVTEAASTLTQLFEPDREIVTYRNRDEAAEKIKYYLLHPDERDSVARSGQNRTLLDHSSQVRAMEVSAIFSRLLTGDQHTIRMTVA